MNKSRELCPWAIHSLTNCDEAWEKDVERLPVADGLGEWIDEDGDVPARVVHEEEEDAEDRGLDGVGDNLDQDHEQNPEPSLGFMEKEEKKSMSFLELILS